MADTVGTAMKQSLTTDPCKYSPSLMSLP